MRFLQSFVAVGLSIWSANASEVKIDESDMNRQYCAGMYSKASWSGPVDPYISIKLLNNKDANKDELVSLIVFEWKDKPLIGVINEQTGEQDFALCSDSFIQAGACNETDKGEFIVSRNATTKGHSQILTQVVNLKDPKPIKYAIKKTGYYCMVTEGISAEKYSGVGVFRNAYGELLATQIPKLPFYGGISLVYTIMAGYWGFLYYQHRRDILAVQNYITAILVLLVVEMILTWGFYDYMNHRGGGIGSKVFLIVVSILNAARSAFSFFLLLIVCMGYGVVKLTLGRAMFYVRCLGIAHFAFGLIYSIVNLLTPPENAGMVSLLTGLPLATTMTVFYMATLNSLTHTLKDLRDRKQFIKEAMYKKLWWAILATVMFIFVFVLFNGASAGALRDPDYFPRHWQTRWFIIDGWLNLVYLIDVAWVAYIWRPTANNRRFAMSDEIAQDDDGHFELGDIGLPGDSEDEDEEAYVGTKPFHASQTSGVAPVGAAAGASSSSQARPTTTRTVLNEEEGETIFAVDSDDDDDDDSDAEDGKLVKSK